MQAQHHSNASFLPLKPVQVLKSIVNINIINIFVISIFGVSIFVISIFDVCAIFTITIFVINIFAIHIFLVVADGQHTRRGKVKAIVAAIVAVKRAIDSMVEKLYDDR